jgi:Flp pilus assembly protein TadG
MCAFIQGVVMSGAHRTKVEHRMHGLAVVEMAIVAPVLLLILFSILEIGVVLYDKAVITNATFQLAQAGTVMTSTSQSSPPSSTEMASVISQVTATSAVSNVVGTSLVSFGGASAATATASIGSWDGLGYPLTVTVNYNYGCLVLSGLMKLFSGLSLPNPIPISTTASMYLN